MTWKRVLPVLLVLLAAGLIVGGCGGDDDDGGGGDSGGLVGGSSSGGDDSGDAGSGGSTIPGLEGASQENLDKALDQCKEQAQDTYDGDQEDQAVDACEAAFGSD